MGQTIDPRTAPQGSAAQIKMALLGRTGHFQYYARSLAELAELTIVAAAPASEEESPADFARAPGVGPHTRLYPTAEALLDAESLDIVQICARPDRLAPLIAACAKRRIPVIADKPLAMDEAALAALYAEVVAAGIGVVPMHAYRGHPALRALRAAVYAGGIGTFLLGSSQKSYKWGRRSDLFRSPRTFPGLAAYIGIHAFDWLHWLLGDIFTAVQGWERAARPEYPACASHGVYVLETTSGGLISVTCDYLRPDGAATHGDDRMRLAGTAGVAEARLAEDWAQCDTPAGVQRLTAEASPYWFAQALLGLVGQGPPFVTVQEAFRVTEIALKAQRAAREGTRLDLRASRYRPSPPTA